MTKYVKVYKSIFLHLFLFNHETKVCATYNKCIKYASHVDGNYWLNMFSHRIVNKKNISFIHEKKMWIESKQVLS